MATLCLKLTLQIIIMLTKMLDGPCIKKNFRPNCTLTRLTYLRRRIFKSTFVIHGN